MRYEGSKYCFKLVWSPELYSTAREICENLINHNPSEVELVKLNSLEKLYAFETFLKRKDACLSLSFNRRFSFPLPFVASSVLKVYYIHIMSLFESWGNFTSFKILVDLKAPGDIWIQGMKHLHKWKYHDGTLMDQYCPLDLSNGLGEHYMRFRTYAFQCADYDSSPLSYVCEAYI